MIKNEKNNNTRKLPEVQYFYTSELALSAALSCLGFQLISLQRQTTGNGRVNFTFEQSDELNSAVEDYWSDTARVSPKKYFFSLRELKSRLWAMKEDV